MKRLSLFLLMTFALASNAMALVVDEALIALANKQGVNIHNMCIAKPPVKPDAIAACATLYTRYTATLNAVNAPLAIVPSIDPSPYSWSPFDICRYEVAHMVFNSIATEPYYCPTV